jgi:hypothetical protein
MKANELRIGNLYEYRMYDELEKPKSWWEVCRIDHEDITRLCLYPEDKDYRAIPIKKELLLKTSIDGLNAINDNGTVWFPAHDGSYLELRQADGFWYPIIGCSPEVSSDGEQRIGLERISFMHEFQNLVFALRRVEAIIETR